MLKISDRLIVCGQAMSHCVNFTLRDILKHWDGDRARLMLLQNGAYVCGDACLLVRDRCSKRHLILLSFNLEL